MQRMATSRPSRQASRFCRGIDVEATELGDRRRLTRPELDPAAGHEVEHRQPLGGANRVVVLGRGLDDAVAEANVARSLRSRREEHLRCRGVAVLLEEVVLDLPHVVDAEPVGQLDLVERVLHQSQLGTVVPRTRQLVLVEDPEPHRRIVARSTSWPTATASSSRRGPASNGSGRTGHSRSGCWSRATTCTRVSLRCSPTSASSQPMHDALNVDTSLTLHVEAELQARRGGLRVPLPPGLPVLVRRRW